MSTVSTNTPSDAANTRTPTGYPALRLATEQLQVQLALPDAQAGHYRGVRFDHAGLVSRVTCGAHTYLAPLVEQHDPTHHDHVPGLAEEFGINGAVGFDEARPGDTFVKIGVGELVRPDDEPYSFARNYAWAQLPAWQVINDLDVARFAQTLVGPRGWSYRYVKTLRLGHDQPTLTVQRSLTNLGQREIETEHYGHNFMVFDDRRDIGPGLEIDWHFEPRIKDLKGPAIVRCEGRTMKITGSLEGDDAIWMRVLGHENAGPYRATMRRRETGGEVTIAGDRAPGRVVLWSRSPSICPEFFVPLRVAPRQTVRWQTVYTFKA